MADVAKKWFLLQYEVVPDYLERRGQYRADHLAIAREAHDRGDLTMAGAYADPADGATLVWHTADTGPIEDFVGRDPYVKNGLVTRWRIRSWTVVIGG